METYVKYYTDASERYDYGYVTRVETEYVYEGSRGWTPLYLVFIPVESADYQTGRYRSGLHTAMTPSELVEAMDYGYVTEARFVETA